MAERACMIRRWRLTPAGERIYRRSGRAIPWQDRGRERNPSMSAAELHKVAKRGVSFYLVIEIPTVGPFFCRNPLHFWCACNDKDGSKDQSEKIILFVTKGFQHGGTNSGTRIAATTWSPISRLAIRN